MCNMNLRLTEAKKAKYFCVRKYLSEDMAHLQRWHSIKEIEEHGDYAIIITHCNKKQDINNLRVCFASTLPKETGLYFCPVCKKGKHGIS